MAHGAERGTLYIPFFVLADILRCRSLPEGRDANSRPMCNKGALHGRGSLPVTSRVRASTARFGLTVQEGEGSAWSQFVVMVRRSPTLESRFRRLCERANISGVKVRFVSWVM